MCTKGVSLCCIIVTNIIVLLLCLGGIGFTIWAQTSSELEKVWDIPDIKISATDIAYVYDVSYGVLGSIAGISIIGLIACCCCQKCCMTIYAILIIIINIVMHIVFVAWIVVFSYGLANLKGELYDVLYGYQSEWATNADSIAINVLQIVFDGCGVEDWEDYLDKSKVPDYDNSSRKALGAYYRRYPLTCCLSMGDVIDEIKKGDFSEEELEKLAEKSMDDCPKDGLDDKKGLNSAMKKVLGIAMGVGAAVLLALCILLTLLTCAACTVIKSGPEGNDKYTKNYNEGKAEKGEKENLEAAEGE